MMNSASTILLGVVSGVFTAALVLLLGKIFRTIIIPWYQGIIYEGIDLHGEWFQEFEKREGVEVYFDLTINQDAHSLNGKMIYGHKNKGKKPITYEVEGSVWEGYVRLNMKSTDRKKIAFATALFKVSAGGDQLEGVMNYRNFETDSVSSAELNLERR